MPVLKCAAGLLVLVMIAAGPWAFLAKSGSTAAIAEHRAPLADTAVAPSKRVYDERRRVYDAARQGSPADRITASNERSAVE